MKNRIITLILLIGIIGYNISAFEQKDVERLWNCKKGENLGKLDLSKYNINTDDKHKDNNLFLEEVNLENSLMNGANLFNEKNKIGPVFHGCNLKKVNFEKAKLEGADFKRANLERADFTDAKLNFAKFNDAYLYKADFEPSEYMYDTSAASTDFSGAFLSEANFTWVDLSNAILADTFSCEANFSHADLSGALLSNAILWETEFGWADLKNAKFINAKLDFARFCGDRNELDSKALFRDTDFTDASGFDVVFGYSKYRDIKNLNWKNFRFNLVYSSL